MTKKKAAPTPALTEFRLFVLISDLAEVSKSLLSVVQTQQLQIDSLKKAFERKGK